MNRRALWIVIVVIALFWGLSAVVLWADAGTAARETYSANVVLAVPTIPSLTPSATPAISEAQASLTGGPNPFCPGDRLFYTFRLTNTGTTALSGVLITDVVPEETWDDQGRRVVVWNVPSVAPGEMLGIELILHSYTTVQYGQSITNTFQYSADQLPTPAYATVVYAASRSACANTPTPTPTYVATRTATRTQSPTQAATPSATQTPTSTETALPSVTPLPIETETPVPSPTETATALATDTATPTETIWPSETPTSTVTPEASTVPTSTPAVFWLHLPFILKAH